MATAHIYPGADTKSQWFASAYRGDTMPHPNVIVLHTTEGSSWPSYSGGSTAPTFTVHPDGRVRQHFPANVSARALVNKAGGVETNTLNVVQIELIGTCAKGGPGVFWPTATDAQLAGLVKLVKWLTATYPIPLKSTGRKWLAYPSSYGSSGGQRMSNSEWLGFNGICGHQHVPENDHGDPGNFPIARLIALVGGTSPSTTIPEEDPLAGFSKQDIHDAVWRIDDLQAPADAPDLKTNPTWQPQSILRDIQAIVRANKQTEAAQTAAIAKLASLIGTGVDTATVVDAVRTAIADAVVQVSVDVTGKEA